MPPTFAITGAFGAFEPDLAGAATAAPRDAPHLADTAPETDLEVLLLRLSNSIQSTLFSLAAFDRVFHSAGQIDEELLNATLRSGSRSAKAMRELCKMYAATK